MKIALPQTNCGQTVRNNRETKLKIYNYEKKIDSFRFFLFILNLSVYISILLRPFRTKQAKALILIHNMI